MVTLEQLRRWSLAFDGATEEPHFEKLSFRVKKKIFVTVDKEGVLACLMLTPVEQSVFCTSSEYIYPVPNAWGKKGATYVELKKVPVRIFKDALRSAYNKNSGK